MKQNGIDETFEALTGYAPWRWQSRWTHALARGEARNVNAPTGCGKTALIAGWMAARITGGDGTPTRLCWVIDRRGVVDQIVADAERWARQAGELGLDVAVSTLRGEKRTDVALDPSKPAVIVGTTDMIGSRLLMRGYGVSWKQHAQYAGLLANDTLIALDEAHLGRPFLDLVKTLAARPDTRDLHAVGISASLDDEEAAGPRLDDPDLEEALRKRLSAPKKIVRKPNAAPEEEALRLADAKLRALVIVRQPGRARRIARKLQERTKRRVLLVTGEQRTLERLRMHDELERWRRPPAEAQETEYLVGTTALEVGFDVTSDVLISDPTDAVGVQQRAGRLNREGASGDARLIICGEPTGYGPDESGRRKRSLAAEKQTAAWLRGKADASPAALADAPETAKYPGAKTVPLTAEDVAALACTTRPAPAPRVPVEVLIHGIDAPERPRVEIAVREELDEIADAGGHAAAWPGSSLEAWRKHYRVLPVETASIPLDRVRSWLRNEQDRGDADAPAGTRLEDEVPILEVRNGEPTRRSAEKIRQREPFPGSTLVFPTRWIDVDEWGSVEPRATRNEEPAPDAACAPGTGRTIELHEHRTGACFQATDTGPWRCIERTDERRTTARADRQTLREHRARTEAAAIRLIEALQIDDPGRTALIEFARFHDLGKTRPEWQRWFGAADEPEPLAHGGAPGDPALLAKFRHELASVADAGEPLSALGRALILGHHGRARPWMPAEAAGRDAGRGIRRIADGAPVVYETARALLGDYGLAYLATAAAAADVAGGPRKDPR